MAIIRIIIQHFVVFSKGACEYIHDLKRSSAFTLNRQASKIQHVMAMKCRFRTKQVQGNHFENGFRNKKIP